MIVIPTDKEVDCFIWADIYHAKKEAELIRLKNKVPQHTYEGLHATVTIKFTERNHMHIDWSKK